MHRLIRKFKYPLYKNSIFLMFSSVTEAVLDDCTRLYSAEDVKFKTQMKKYWGG